MLPDQSVDWNLRGPAGAVGSASIAASLSSWKQPDRLLFWGELTVTLGAKNQPGTRLHLTLDPLAGAATGEVAFQRLWPLASP